MGTALSVILGMRKILRIESEKICINNNDLLINYLIEIIYFNIGSVLISGIESDWGGFNSTQR